MSLFEDFCDRLADALLGIPHAGPQSDDNPLYADTMRTERYNMRQRRDKRAEFAWEISDTKFAIDFLNAYAKSRGEERRTWIPDEDAWYKRLQEILRDWDQFPDSLDIEGWVASKERLFELLSKITFPLPP